MGGGRIVSFWGNPRHPGLLDLSSLAENLTDEDRIYIGYLAAINSAVLCVAAMPNGEQVVVGGTGGALFLFNTNTGAVAHDFSNRNPLHNRDGHNRDGHDGDVRAVTVTPDGLHIISCSPGDGAIKVWSATDHTLRSTSHDMWSPFVRSVVAMPDNLRYLSGGRDGKVRVWGLDGDLQNTFSKLHRWYTTKVCEVSALVALPDNRRALAGWSSGTITLFDVSNGGILGTFRPHLECVRCLAVDPDGCRFVSGSDDKTVRIVELPAQ